MKAKDLYETDETLRLLIQTWVTEYRAPIGLADRLRELGLESQAEGADTKPIGVYL